MNGWRERRAVLKQGLPVLLSALEREARVFAPA